MSLLDLFAGFRTRISRNTKRCQNAKAKWSTEALEDRVLLYAASGNEWPSSELVTISIVPDGTNLGGVTSNLNSEFNSNPYLSGGWLDEIKRAAQDWAKVTNLNFVFVEDNGDPSGSGDYQQGDPNFGDIRIGGFDFGSSTLASAYMPPDINNFSIAGDFNFNTGTTFGIGSSYDLYTVAVHEIGHALGLEHSSASSTSVMWATYNGVKSNLATDDISGIRSIYSGGNVRTKDSYETASGNDTINDAKNISSALVRSQKWAILDGLDITTTSDVDFYKVNMPAWSDSTVEFTVQSAGFSQLAPKFTIYDKDKTTILGTVDGAGDYGTTLSLSVTGVTGTDVFYLKVEAAETTSFGVGSYGITIDLGASTPPELTPPDTMLENGNPLSSGGGSALSPESDSFEADDIIFTGVAPTIDEIPSKGKVSTFTGTGTPGAIVTVFYDGVELGSATADELGLWSLTLKGKRGLRFHRLSVG